MIVIGHRGAAGHEPENTLRSIARAIEFGADWVEIDVRAVADQLIVLHDDRLERTTDGHGPIEAVDFPALRRLNAGKGERIPLLTEVIDLIDARVGLNIELKGAGAASAVMALVHDYVARRPDWRGRFLLSSFDLEQTDQVSPAADWRIGVLFKEPADAALARALRLGAWSINPSLRQVTPQLVHAAHAHGLKVLVYTVNRESDLRAMRQLGVDGVFSDYPDRARAMFAAAT